MNFRSKLLAIQSTKLADLTSIRNSDPRKASEDQDVDEIVPEVISSKQLRLDVRNDWQHACEAYATSHDGEQLDEDLITGYVEGAVREYVLDRAVSSRFTAR
jgi:hypothetical protein